MEFIQKKTIDQAVEYFLPKAAESEISLVWDRYEGQLPECGFCETGLSCRDCLQGPCISHPFRDSNKMGVCGKDKDVLASQSLLRLALKGTMTCLDRISEFAEEVESKQIRPRNKAKTDQVLKEIQGLFKDGGSLMMKEFPKPLIQGWKENGILPEGVARDLFKSSQTLEGGIAGVEEILLRAFKSALLGGTSQWLYGKLKRSVFGDQDPTKIEVNLGVLKNKTPNLLICGPLSPILKKKILDVAEKMGVQVTGACTSPLIPPFHFPILTGYGSQEIPLMTGAVDLVVAGNQSVNPSLFRVAKEFEVSLISADGLSRRKDIGKFAREVVEQAIKSFDFRRHIPRDIPEIREVAMMGFSPEDPDIKKIVEALNKGQLKGIVVLSGSNNVKYTQDQETLLMTQELLRNDILCVSQGEASRALAKYGLLNPIGTKKNCGENLSKVLSSLKKEIPPVLDFGEEGALNLLLEMMRVGKKGLQSYPIVACFPEANRSSEVTQALWMVAMGIPTFFWPALPITGSQKTMDTLSKLCQEKFGSKLNIPMEKKMEALTKADLIIKTLKGEEGFSISGKPWK